MNDPAVLTHCRVSFDLMEPRAEDVRLVDIAWSLAGQRRYLNHTDFPVTTAEHSLLVASLVPTKDRLAALLHDAEETYTGDIIRPARAALEEMGDGVDLVGALAASVRRAVFQAFEIADQLPLAAEVEEADKRAFSIECAVAFPDTSGVKEAIITVDRAAWREYFYCLQEPPPSIGQEAWARASFTEAVRRAALDQSCLWSHACLPDDVQSVLNAFTPGAEEAKETIDRVISAAQEREPPHSARGTGRTGPGSGLSGELGGSPPVTAASRERGESIPQMLCTLLGLDPSSGQAAVVRTDLHVALRRLVGGEEV